MSNAKASFDSNGFRIFRNKSNIGYCSLRKQPKSNGFRIPRTKSNIDFCSLRSNPNPMVSKFLKTSPILAFAHCESNPNPMVSACLETSPILVFAYCESNPNQIPHKPILYSYIIHTLSNLKKFKVLEFNLVHLKRDFTYQLLQSYELL